MRTINPWINFNGNAEEAFTFYKSVFGGEFTKIIRFKDLASAEFPVAANEADKLMHIALPIGKQNVLIANDIPEFMGRVNENENRSKIAVAAESREEEQNGGGRRRIGDAGSPAQREDPPDKLAARLFLLQPTQREV